MNDPTGTEKTGPNETLNDSFFRLSEMRIPARETASHLKLLTSATVLSLTLSIVTAFTVSGLPMLVLCLIMFIPALFAAIRYLMATDRISTQRMNFMGPGIASLGIALALFFLFTVPAANQNTSLILLAFGTASLLFPTPVILLILLLGLLAWSPVQWSAMPTVHWTYFAAGLLISVSSRFFTELSRLRLQRLVEEALRESAENRELLEGLRLSKQHYEDLLKQSNDLVIETDSQLKVLSVNLVFERLTGWDRAECVGKPLAAFIHSSSMRQFEKFLDWAAEGKLNRVEVKLNSKTGGIPLIEMTRQVTQVGTNAPIAFMARNITEKKEIERQLVEIRERFDLAAEGANDGLWDWDLVNGQIYLSPRWKMMLGYGTSEIGNHPSEWFDRVHPRDLRHVKAAIRQNINGETPNFECTFRLKHKDGQFGWVSSRGIAVRNESGNVTRLVGSQSDITRFKVTEQQLQHDAFHDPLTGLANRALFTDRLGQAIQRVRDDSAYGFAIIFLDLDRFKVINDSLGHEAGDQLLIAAARRIEECVRDNDIVARLGGDEFTVLLNGTKDTERAVQIVARIQEHLQAPFYLSGQEVFTTASLGIAFAKTGHETAVDLLRNADIAMYRAKAAGRARYIIFDQDMHANAVALLQLENDLRRAIERKELCAHYQPIICLRTGRITGFEALARWNHPKKGILLPVDFVSLAEETGLIVPLGWQILREACRQAKAWQGRTKADSDLTISVNFSPRQLGQGEMIRQVEKVLNETGLAPNSLKLEITEGAIMDDTLIKPLRELKSLGVDLHLDDFGTGYSSLRYLHRFPLDASKIDRSFVGAMITSSESAKIVRSMVALSHSLGMEVVAEGVETANQASHLRFLKCEYGQGLLYSRPLAASDAEGLIGGILAQPPISRESSA